MRKAGKIICYIFICIFLFMCRNKEDIPDLLVKRLDNYPSASSIEYHNGRLYLMGDDATHLMVLDMEFTIVDSMPIVLHPGKRIPKDIKPDLEASAIYIDNNEPVLFLFGSGSFDPYRDAGWKYNLKTGKKENIYLQPLYSRIKEAGVDQINIEGACFTSDKLLLVNRGNKGYRQNQLILIDEKFLENDSSYQVLIIPLEIQKDTASFKGISGLTYAKVSDQLIMTVSTEDTRNAYDDGAIGKSYLWIIDEISRKLNSNTLQADRIIDLEAIDPGFKNQKIESATVIEETNDSIQLALVADNDDGSSTVFKISIKN